MTTFYFPAYKCSLCEQKFNDGLCYVGLADALNHVSESKKYEPVHHCEHGNIGFGKFAGFERVDKNDESWQISWPGYCADTYFVRLGHHYCIHAEGALVYLVSDSAVR